MKEIIPQKEILARLDALAERVERLEQQVQKLKEKGNEPKRG